MSDEYTDPGRVRPDKTFELRIVFDGNDNVEFLKESVKVWLTEHGVESFVEGVVDEIDVEYDYSSESDNRFEEFGGGSSPISIYKYDQAWLLELKKQLLQAFPGRFIVEDYEHETEEWTEGWKESFKPIETSHLYVRPPWEEYPEGCQKKDIVIDPGMAFGTGQHATTKLCLLALEELVSTGAMEINDCEMIDVGTGSGILSVAAKKLGVSSVTSSDVDPDAVISARKNARTNDVIYRVYKGSVLKNEDGKWDFIIANILSVVLKKLMDDLASELKPGGILMMSGIIAEEEKVMIDLASAKGLKLVSSTQMDDWVCLVMSK